MANFYKVKSNSGGEVQVKDLDSVQGIVTGYFSTFNFVDSDGDSIAKGAFSKTISENGPNGKDRIKYLYQHDYTKPIGKIITLSEDESGLYFEGKLAVDTTAGRDAMEYYKEGILKEHSIGFQVVKGDYSDMEKAYIIKEVKLYEGSQVTWGANENTPMTGMKSLFAKPDEAVSLISKMTNLLRKGNLSDESCLILERQLKQLQEYISTLSAEPAAPDAQVEAYKPGTLLDIFDTTLNN